MSEPVVESVRIATNGIELAAAVSGSGPALLLVHGWPHTWRVWTDVIGPLSLHHRVIAVDLRGAGDSTRAVDGYDASTLGTDLLGVLDALGLAQADVMAIDAGVAPAFVLAMGRPDRLRRLVLMESLIGTLAGAEDFLAGGPPWWFGFHAVPGLAEVVLEGHEAQYLDWFYRAGTHDHRGIAPEISDAFVRAYTGRESLRCGFEHYRAMAGNAGLITQMVAERRLIVPTMTVGAFPVGDALHRQLKPITDDLTGRVIEDCGHIIPLDRPEALLEHVEPFLAVV